MMTWVVVVVYTQILPLTPTCARTALGTVWPPLELRFDAAGCTAPQGKTVRYPAPVGSVTVTFRLTALALAATPARPATGSCNTEPPAIDPIPWSWPSTVV